MTCTDCGAPTSKRTAQRCRACAQVAHRRLQEQHAQERVELIEDYLSVGIDPRRIAADFGITPEALERQLRRRGHHELADRVHVPFKGRKNDYSRHKQCADCGVRVMNTSTRCRTCANKAQNRWESRSPWKAA